MLSVIATCLSLLAYRVLYSMWPDLQQRIVTKFNIFVELALVVTKSSSINQVFPFNQQTFDEQIWYFKLRLLTFTIFVLCLFLPFVPDHISCCILWYECGICGFYSWLLKLKSCFKYFWRILILLSSYEQFIQLFNFWRHNFWNKFSHWQVLNFSLALEMGVDFKI